MRPMKLISWNVNGVRAVHRKGLLDWLAAESPDVLGLQEIKAQEDQLDPALLQPLDYHAYWNWGERKGYSGVAVLTKQPPISVRMGIGVERFDSEGRVILAEYPTFTLLNVYFPNGQSGADRLLYKLDFYDRFLDFMEGLRAQGQRLICCGDYNTAHTEIDLARPKENEKTSGFLPVERAWMDKLEARGYVDSFRVFNKDGGNYTYWDMKSRARARNVGWRIDYFYISPDLLPSLARAFILPEVEGSDHCPLGIELVG
ncbi:MAG: exodeoxyribonuclease III [Dehalococcoidia bacterium]|nr:exodeoxyribonuclease III [Dehalococcoidia bacterium]